MSQTELTWRIRRPEGFYSFEVDTPASVRPVRTFLPTSYEPNYAYPLVVFLHGHGSSEDQVMRLAPRLSRRNFISVGLRGPHSLGSRRDGRASYSWGADGLCDAEVEDYVMASVDLARRTYHVHSERIYLAGICEGATLAYRLGLTHPDKFAGVVALNGCIPRHSVPLFRFPDVRNLRVLIGHGIANAVVPLTLAKRDHRLLYTAGLDVTMETYATTHKLHPDMLRDANRWLVDQIGRDEEY